MFVVVFFLGPFIPPNPSASKDIRGWKNLGSFQRWRGGGVIEKEGCVDPPPSTLETPPTLPTPDVLWGAKVGRSRVGKFGVGGSNIGTSNFGPPNPSASKDIRGWRSWGSFQRWGGGGHWERGLCRPPPPSTLETSPTFPTPHVAWGAGVGRPRVLEVPTLDLQTSTFPTRDLDGSCFQNPLFLMLAFPSVGFIFVCFLFYFFLLLFDKSSCYVLVFVSVVLGFLGFVMCYLLDCCLVGFWFCFLRFKVQVRWPPYFFVFFVLFSLLGYVFLLFFAFGFLEGFKGQVRLPEGPRHLAINPP